MYTQRSGDQTGEVTQEMVWVTVDYDISVLQMVDRVKYSPESLCRLLSDDCVKTGKGKARKEVFLVNFDRVMESDEVLRELCRSNLEAASYETLLAFGAQHHPKQPEDHVVALGFRWEYNRSNFHVASLRYWHETWTKAWIILTTEWWHQRWGPKVRFIAVRKTAP